MNDPTPYSFPFVTFFSVLFYSTTLRWVASCVRSVCSDRYSVCCSPCFGGPPDPISFETPDMNPSITLATYFSPLPMTSPPLLAMFSARPVWAIIGDCSETRCSVSSIFLVPPSGFYLTSTLFSYFSSYAIFKPQCRTLTASMGGQPRLLTIDVSFKRFSRTNARAGGFRRRRERSAKKLPKERKRRVGAVIKWGAWMLRQC